MEHMEHWDTDWSYKHKTLPGHELKLRLNTRQVSCGSLTTDPTHAPLVTAQSAVQLRAEGGSDNNTVPGSSSPRRFNFILKLLFKDSVQGERIKVLPELH